MKAFCFVVVLCFVLSRFSPTSASRSSRSLFQATVSVSSSSTCSTVNGKCSSSAKVTATAKDDEAEAIGSALSYAIASVEDGGDVDAEAEAFSQAIARAYARIVSTSTLKVFNTGTGYACAYTKVSARASAMAIASAVSTAFAKSSNGVANAAADCFSDAVAKASVTAMQKINFGVCVNYGYALVYEKVITVGFAEAVATTFAFVLTSIVDNKPFAEALCESSSVGNTAVITTSG